ncbi:hypothetical protein D9611_003473 [Ephemerocybe angulata]|uniref:Uncharacterized protein n=1 Tax=Ephemerocybe angulata TaxID=980116 RepID=A0A8H5B636_9AGAR|nr:hypothetical protein D9611_003473 [Tulosesus angulatus]
MESEPRGRPIASPVLSAVRLTSTPQHKDKTFPMDSPGQSSEKSKPAFPHNQIVPSSISPASPQESTSLSLSYIDEDDIPGLAQFDDVVTPLAATAEVPDPDRLGEITSTTSKSLKSAKSVSKSVPTAPSILPNSGTLLQRSRSGKRLLLSIFPLSILPGRRQKAKDTLTNHGSTTEALAAPMDMHTHTHAMPTETSSRMAALHSSLRKRTLSSASLVSSTSTTTRMINTGRKLRSYRS